MLVACRRVVVAFAVTAVLLGAVAHRPEIGGADEGRQRESPAAELMVNAASVGVVPVATRLRTSLEIESVSVAASSKTRVGSEALAAAMLVVAIAVCWWRLHRRDRRLTAPLPRSSLAALRAPPAFV